ncbi:MAG: hypothetical protein EP329_23560 [Deltaproteobacteria bacterium]|nr:MAG: hypothetical protein EP329_23560 [Deltaproteobacteria bacterium]
MRRKSSHGALLGATLALALVACTDGGSAVDDATDTAHAADVADDTATDTATAEDTVAPNPCPRPDTAAVDHRVVLRGTFKCSPPATPAEVVLTSADDWSAMVSGLSDCISPAPTVDSVDFDSEYVLVLGTHDFMTCGYDYGSVTTLSGARGPYVELQVTDRSAGCDAACASGMGYVVAVALPRAAGEAPTSCIWVHPGCP